MHRSPAQRAADLVLIEKWVLEGYQLRQMEDKLAEVRPYRLGFRSIWLEIRRLHKMWEQEAVAMVDANKNHMLAVLRKQEAELWEAWEKSKVELTKQTLTKRDGGSGGAKDTKSAVKVSSYGDPAIMRLILDIQRQKADLLGLNAPKKTEVAGKDGGPIVTQTDVTVRDETEFTQENEDALLKRHVARRFGVILGGAVDGAATTAESQGATTGAAPENPVGSAETPSGESGASDGVS